MNFQHQFKKLKRSTLIIQHNIHPNERINDTQKFQMIKRRKIKLLWIESKLKMRHYGVRNVVGDHKYWRVRHRSQIDVFERSST